MSNEYFKRINTTKLYPPFADKLRKVVEAVHARGEDYYATCGLRTVEEQDALFAQGRTAPGNVVTKAKGGYSAHNYAAAADFVRDQDLTKYGVQPDYNPQHYTVLAEEAERLGLEAGLRWTTISDAPHIQLPLKKNGFSWNRLQTLYHEGGLVAVWRAFDKVTW